MLKTSLNCVLWQVEWLAGSSGDVPAVHDQLGEGPNAYVELERSEPGTLPVPSQTTGSSQAFPSARICWVTVSRQSGSRWE